MLEVETSTKEIVRKAILEKEIFDLVPDPLVGFGTVIGQSTTIADFGIEGLTGGKRLVLLYLVKDSIRHLIVQTPRHNAGLVVDDKIRSVDRLLKKRCGIRNKSHLGIDTRQCFN